MQIELSEKQALALRELVNIASESPEIYDSPESLTNMAVNDEDEARAIFSEIYDELEVDIEEK